MIRTADTPGFAGNRVGFKVLNEAAQLAEEHGPVLVERLVGPYTGRALTPLATVDLVGWDIHRAIVDNIHKHAPDEAHATLRLPGVHGASARAKGMLGNKSGGGFFKVENKVEARARSEDRDLQAGSRGEAPGPRLHRRRRDAAPRRPLPAKR